MLLSPGEPSLGHDGATLEEIYGELVVRGIRISVLQLCVFIAVSQLTLHASVATFVLRVLFRRALAAILIPGLVLRGSSLPSLSYSTLNTLIHAGADSRH
jgi:hypothetical protein